MTLLHPMMPFITEEVWHTIADRSDKDCAIVSEWPKEKSFDAKKLECFETAKSIVTEVRSIRASKGLSPKNSLDLIQKGVKGEYAIYEAIIKKLANVSIRYDEKIEGPSASFILGVQEFSVPLDGLIDTTQEKSKLEEELKYQQGFWNSVSKKFSNERFVSNAPSTVVDSERKKMADAESRIASIKESLGNL